MKTLVLIVALVCGVRAMTKCGSPTIKPVPCEEKIVGGCIAKPYSWPWQVALYARGMVLSWEWA